MKNILPKLKELHWIWFWSGNWPMLDCILQRDENFEKSFQKVTGIYPGVTVDFFHNGIITAYHCQEEYDRLEKYLRNRFYKNPSFIKDSFKEYQNKTLVDVRALKRVNAIKNLDSLTNLQLARLFLKARKHFIYNGAMDHYAWYIEKFFVPELQKRLEIKLRELNQIKLLPEYLPVLVTPHKASKIFYERRGLFKIIKVIKRNKALVKAIRSLESKKNFNKIAGKYPKIAELTENHYKRYNWMPVLVNNPPTSLNDLWKEIVYFVKSNESFKVEIKRIGDDFDKRILERQQKIIKELNFDKTTLELIKGLQKNAFNRTEDNVIMSQSSYLIIPLYKEIGKRLGLTYYELKEFTPEEIVKHLKEQKRLTPSLLKQRYRLTCYLVYKGVRKVLIASEAKEIKTIIEDQLQRAKKKKNVFVGKSASLGKVKGKVRLALSFQDAGDIKKGEILVAPATSADFVPAMRKARAIVTEFGGMTSHAAVVSREFGIPCIVGIQGITKVLKNGDQVEVDTNQGVVRILRRKK